MSSIITDAANAAHAGTDRGLQDVLDFLVTQEQLSTTFLTAAIERAEGTPSAAFLPVLSAGAAAATLRTRRVTWRGRTYALDAGARLELGRGAGSRS